MSPVKAIVMAGGFGTRLRPLTSNIPKPMVPMANRPMMEHIIQLLKANGFDDLLIMLYYQPDVIISHFGDGSAFGVKIQYLRPQADLGTAGCVKFAEAQLKEPFLVISADLLTDFSLKSVLSAHRQKKALATLVLTRVTNPLSYGVVIVDENNAVQRFLEKPSWGEVFSDTVNTGIYMLDPAVLEHIPKERAFDFSKDLFPRLLEQKRPLYGYVAKGYWKDVGDLSEYRLAQYDLLESWPTSVLPGKLRKRGEGELIYGEGTQVHAQAVCSGKVLLGKGCKVEEGVKLSRCVIGDKATLKAGAELAGAVLWNEVTIGAGARIEEAVIGNRCKIGDEAQIFPGAIIGDDCVIGDGAIVHSNVKIWPQKRVEDGAVLSSSLIWGEKWTRRLFGAYGISGLCNREVTPELATRIGAVYGAYLGEGAYVATSRDAHMASRMIKRAIISGLLSSGVKVGDLRTAPIPVVRYEIGQEGEAGGVHVRQSPFDPNIVDIKLLDKTGVDLSSSQERAIEQLFLREDFHRATPDRVGEIITPPRAQEYYRAGFLKAIDAPVLQGAKLKIVIDYAFSSASLILPDILGRLGLEVVGLNAYLSALRVTKSAEDFQGALDQLSTIVQTLKADAGFLIDTGAEKVFMVDDKGKRISNETALFLVARLVMETVKGGATPPPASGTVASQAGGGAMGVPVNVSSAIEKLAKPYHVQIKRLRTAPRYIMEASREKDMHFVGDGIGGFIFPEFQPCFDAMFAIVKIMELMARHKAKLHALVQDVPAFETFHQKVPCPWDRKGLVMRRAIDALRSEKSELVDGVKVFIPPPVSEGKRSPGATETGGGIMNGSWVLLLPDPDEATFHIWVEAPTKTEARTLMKEYSEKLREWQTS